MEGITWKIDLLVTLEQIQRRLLALPMLKYRECKPWHGRFGLLRARVLGLPHQHHNQSHENLRIRKLLRLHLLLGRYFGGPLGSLRWLEVPGWTRSEVGAEGQLALVKLTGTRVSDSFTRVVSSLCACVSGYVMNASTDYNLGRTA